MLQLLPDTSSNSFLSPLSLANFKLQAFMRGNYKIYSTPYGVISNYHKDVLKGTVELRDNELHLFHASSFHPVLCFVPLGDAGKIRPMCEHVELTS